VRSVFPLLSLSVAGSGLNAALLAGLYLPGGPYLQQISWLPIATALLSVGAALFVINGGRRRTWSWERLWDAVFALPRVVLVGLAVVLAVLFIDMMAGVVTIWSDLHLERSSASRLLWLNAAGTALLYGALKTREPAAPVSGQR